MRICRAPDCNNPAISQRTVCYKHKHRLRKNGDFDLIERIPKADKLPTDIVKICKVHGELKYHHVNVQYSKYKDKRYKWYQCKECTALKKKRLYDLNPEKYINFSKKTNEKYKEKLKKKQNEQHIKRMINLNDYHDLLVKQDNKCAICKKEEAAKHQNGKIKRLSVDHHHDSGKIRGLLCTKCNTAIGLFKESTEILLSAIEYLKAT